MSSAFQCNREIGGESGHLFPGVWEPGLSEQAQWTSVSFLSMVLLSFIECLLWVIDLLSQFSQEGLFLLELAAFYR